MRPADRQRAAVLDNALQRFDAEIRPLPGIQNAARRNTFLEQLIDSIRRIEFARRLTGIDFDRDCADPNSAAFDPLRAALLRYRAGEIDEAFWLLFLFIHFGRDRTGGWSYIRLIYGRLGNAELWDWVSIQEDVPRFLVWLDKNRQEIKARGHGFGNHRKYESLSAYSDRGTGASVQSYVNWVSDNGGHEILFRTAAENSDGDRAQCFDILYRSMARVSGFGRTARFDYLAMVGKLGFAPIEPGKPYLIGATGPVSGANLLFGGKTKPSTLDKWLVDLGTFINVGMQAIEDSLCNWQKSPDRYSRFRG